jgi:CubicO group peptidase (beta-lactamase class C family)
MTFSNAKFLKKLLLLICINFIVVQTNFAVDKEHLESFTKKGMELWHVPGMSVAVVSNDEIVFQQGFGKTTIKNGKSVDENTLFAIASTTKAMVVAGILMLVDEGKLSLDDPISKHIPELHFKDPSLTRKINIRDLLAHRTGLPSTDYWSFFQEMSLAEQIKRLKTVDAEAPLRTRLIYQNTMFEIAGLLIERLSGKKWEQFLTERLWLPLGMKSTFAKRNEITAKHTAVQPYNYVDNKLMKAKWNFSADYANAAGSVWSSIHDMSLWAQFLLRDGVTVEGKRLIKQSSIEQMFVPHQLSNESDFYPTVKLTKPNWRTYGLGWFQQDFQGRKIDFHTGSLAGLIAIIGLDRAENKAVIVLGNRDHAEMRHALLWEVMDNSTENRRDWNKEVFELYDDSSNSGNKQWQEAQKNRLKKTKPSIAKSKYLGTYQNETMGDIQIVKSGKNLTLKTKLVDLKMSHWHLDTYLVEYKDWGMREFATYNIGADGKISSLELFGMTFSRKDDK